MNNTMLRKLISAHLEDNHRSQATAKTFSLMAVEQKTKLISDILEIGKNRDIPLADKRTRTRNVINNALASYTDVRISENDTLVGILVKLVDSAPLQTLEEKLHDILDEGLRVSTKVSLLDDMDRDILELLIQDIITICRFKEQNDAKYIRLARTINNALSGYCDYRVKGHNMLSNLILKVAGADSRTVNQKGTIPLDILNAQARHVKDLVKLHWPEENAHRDIHIGNMVSMMLDVFESGRQFGKQEVATELSGAMKSWLEGE